MVSTGSPVRIRAAALNRLAQRAIRLLTGAWLTGGRARSRRDPPLERWENRHRLVERLAPGSSFLDLGGMWGVDGEVAFRAERAGAARVVLFDGMDPTDEFQDRHREAGSAVEYVQGDLHDPDDVARLGSFDVVWCTGVVYHSPNPYLQLQHLRALTRRELVLGTEVIPEVPGIENACVFYPGRSPASERAFARAYGERAPTYLGMTHPFDETPMLGYANMWWGLSPSAVRSMLRYSGFDVREEFRYTWCFHDYLAEATRTPDFIPPLGASRARGEERLADVAPDERPGWAPR
jgi:Methyltransferase domain